MKLPHPILLTVICLCPALSATEPPPSPQPNIILIFMDDFGYNDLGIQTYPSTTEYYPNAGPAPAQTVGSNMPEPNQARLLTPRLDSLANEGIRFTSFHANPSCSAARACLMTGRYRSRLNLNFTGVFWPYHNTGLNTTEVTIPELLREQGYATGMIGKWHLGYNPSQQLAFQMMPTRHGFEEYYGLPYSNDMSPLHLIDGETVLNADVSASAEQAQLTWKYTERALDFIERKAAKNRPFFLYLSHSMTHRPTVPSDREFTNADGTTWPKFQGTSGVSYYYDVVREIDHSTGRILDLLNNLNIANNTVVIFTSDNGPWKMSGLDLGQNAMGSAYPLRGFKQSSLEGGVRVPFLVRWPGQISAGVVTGQLAGLTDMLPTLVGLSGGTPPTDRTIDGVDLWPILSGQATSISRNYAIDENSGSLPLNILSGDWKLRNGALYDLANDIQETTDLSGNAAYVSQLSDLQSQLTAVRNSISAENEPLGTYTSYEVRLSTDTVNFGEGESGDFAIRLSHNPGASVTVRVSRFSGDPTLTVASGPTLNFNTSNWSEAQTVTLTDAADGIPGAATFRVTIDGQQAVREVFARAGDNEARAVEGMLVWPKNEVALLESQAVKMVGKGSVLLDTTTDPEGSIYQWEKVSGAGDVTFTDATAPETGLSFSQNGEYTLRFTADHPNGIISKSVDFHVMVGTAPPGQYKYEPVMAYDANLDTDADSTWENVLAPGTRDWTLAAGLTRSASDPAPQLPFIEAAWVFPGSDIPAGGSSLHLNDYSNGNASIELWFKPVSLPTATPQVVWETGGDIGASLIVDGNTLQFVVDDSGSGVANGALASGTLAPTASQDGFVHFVGVIDLAADTIKLFIDGSLVATETIASVSDWCGSSHSGLGTICENAGSETTDDSHLGGNNQLGTNFARFSGQIAHMLFYDRALSTAEISDLAAGPRGLVPADNLAPVVTAGSDQSVSYTAHAAMNGSASDDGRPAGSGLSTEWSLESGPGTPAFSNPLAASTTATFDLPGTYQLWLEADDSEVKVYDDVLITVAPLTYSEWAGDFAFDPGDNVQSADPDGDRTNNLIEWALGKNPLQPDTPDIQFKYSPVPLEGKNRLTLTFTVPRNRAPNITFQESPDLTGWDPVTSSLPSKLTISETLDQWTMEVDVEEAEPKWFLQIQVED